MPTAPKASRFAWLSRWRAVLASVGTVAYVGAVALWREGGVGLRPWALTWIAMAVAWIAARRKGSRAWAIATWGLAIAIASIASGEEYRWLDAAGCVGAGVASIAAQWAIANVVSAPSLATRKPPPVWPGTVLLVMLWAYAILACVEGAMQGAYTLAYLVRPVVAAAAGISGVVLLLSGLIVLRMRRLEMGVTSRIVSALGLLATVTILGTGAALVGLEEPDRLGRVGVALGGVVVIWVALHGDGVKIAQIGRRALVLSLAGGTIALFGAALIEGRTHDRVLTVILTALGALVVGAAARRLEEPMRPMRGAWLDACDESREVLLREEPSVAIEKILLLLRAPAQGISQSPELWTFSPTRVATIDTAGYVHERDAELPAQVLAIASQEPEATLRAEVLDALEVRRPDLRPLIKWMENRNALSATVVTRGGEPEGLLVLPAGPRWEFLTLEEARSIKRLADALAAVCHARGAGTRALEREQALGQRADGIEEEGERLRHELSIHVGRHALAAQRLARPATVGVYSAASRMALEAIERRTSAGAPLVIVAPSGVDAVPFVARAHLHGPRSAQPLVLVDGTQAREHDLARWNDKASSPLALADRGTLVLLDAPVLPLDIQRTIARALAEKRPPWERADPLDIALVVTSACSLEGLIDAGRLDASFATRLGDARDAPIVLPRLRDRGEDLRAIVTDRLAREGLRTKGVPVGIESAAFGRLVDHPFPGEDAELQSIVQRLVAGCRGDVIRVEDVDALGLSLPLFPRDGAREPSKRIEAVPSPGRASRRRSGKE